ncbi:MAG: TadE/TadG family type IV pilus assembly protein [Planctomycetota bacterium]
MNLFNFTHKQRRSRQNGKRSGAAAVEAAVCFPVIFLILVASIEVCGGMFQNYDAHTAAFELSKQALKRNTTTDDLQAKAAQLLPQLGFDTYDVRIDVLPRTVNTESVESTPYSTFLIPQTGVATPGLEELPRGTILRLTLTVERPSFQAVE